MNSNPPTYQYARYSDWIIPYLDKEYEKNSKISYNRQIIQKKLDNIKSSLNAMKRIQDKFTAW